MIRLPLAPHHLRCKDGCIISILDPLRRIDPSQDDEAYIVDPGVRLRAVPEDPAVEASGLAGYWRHHNRREGNDAEYSRVPVATVRAFIRAHGGFAEAGEEALAELKRAGEAEKPPLPRPPQRRRRSPRRALFWGVDVAGRAPAPADMGALDQRDGEPAPPRIGLDALTPAVIEVREVLAEFDAGFLYRGREPAHPVEEFAVWGKRASAGAGLAARLIIVEHDRFARHPLREEGRQLRERLFAFYEEAKRELPRAGRRANGIYS